MQSKTFQFSWLHFSHKARVHTLSKTCFSQHVSLFALFAHMFAGVYCPMFVSTCFIIFRYPRQVFPNFVQRLFFPHAFHQISYIFSIVFHQISYMFFGMAWLSHQLSFYWPYLVQLWPYKPVMGTPVTKVIWFIYIYILFLFFLSLSFSISLSLKWTFWFWRDINLQGYHWSFQSGPQDGIAPITFERLLAFSVSWGWNMPWPELYHGFLPWNIGGSYPLWDKNGGILKLLGIQWEYHWILY